MKKRDYPFLYLLALVAGTAANPEASKNLWGVLIVNVLALSFLVNRRKEEE